MLFRSCFVDKSGDKNYTGSGEGINNYPNGNESSINNLNSPSSNIKTIILGILIIVAIFTLIFFGYKRYFFKTKKYNSNSINGLINKEVYLESGHHIGKVNDVILGKTRIEGLSIELDKKHKFDKKGIIIDYKQVKSVGEIIIIDESVSEYLERIKNKYTSF